MSDYYHLVTAVSAQEDNKQITATLKAMKSGALSNDLRLLNFYNEIPVSYGATIDYLDDDMVDLTVHQNQLVVMKFDKKTILRSKHFPHDVIASVFRAKANTGIVTLTNFAYAVVRADRRRFVRVTVKDRIDVIFKNGSHEIRGRLADISLCGIALVSGANVAVETQAEGAALLSLQDKSISLPAKLVKMVPAGGEVRYIFEIETSSKEEELISQFIFQRQVEIIRELKDTVA